VQLSDVYIPDDDVMGAVGAGWQAANTTLGSERTAIGAGASNRSPVSWQTLAAMAHTGGADVDRVGRQQLAAFFVSERALSLLGQRMQDASEGSRPHPSLAKLARAELAWQAVGAATAVAAPVITARVPDDDPGAEGWAALVTGAPAQSIGGGTSEVMKNIVAERVLGLPREPRHREPDHRKQEPNE
jgi:alkylation response protein AidB-like acyl-CoA dehydrogenase